MFALAQSTKTFLITAEGLAKNSSDIPSPYDQQVAAEKAKCFHLNMTNVASAVRICTILRTHGIDVACIKGVPRGFEIYDRWDVRRTGDIDLLVHPKDYREAAEVITKNGYYTPVPVDSVWWHTYLGESPYLPSSTTGPIVDLHWKLDQPGTPAMPDISGVLRRTQSRTFGKFVIPTLSQADALMLTATSIGKAIRAQETWLVEAHEIALSVRKGGELSRENLNQYAHRQGVGRLWQFVLRQVDRLFPPDVGTQEPWDDELACSVLGLPAPNQHSMFRTQLLWLWSDGTALRPLRFAQEFLRVRAAEYRHDVEEAEKARSAAG